VSEGLQSAATICIEPTAFQAVVVQFSILTNRHNPLDWQGLFKRWT
jgi:hypothetical protein